jgi:hypothetical protein
VYQRVRNSLKIVIVTIQDFIATLRRDGCSFASILRATAEYAKQREDWSGAVHYLLLAAQEVEKAQERITQNKSPG